MGLFCELVLFMLIPKVFCDCYHAGPKTPYAYWPRFWQAE